VFPAPLRSAQLGLTPAQIAALPRCGDLPSVSGAGLLGSLYVYEGTALGGQVIARRLRQSLGTAQSYAFYRENAVRTGQHWKAFCWFLETRETVSLAAICASAVAVFDAFGSWFESAPSGAVPDFNA
jgi:heme oxygenase